MSAKENDPFRFSHAAEEIIGDLRHVAFNEPRKMKRRATKELAPLIEDLLQKYQIGRSGPEESIRQKWSELVGHANAAYSHAVSIDPRGKLLVLVSHSVVRSELILHRARILADIQKIPGCAAVRDIYFRAG